MENLNPPSHYWHAVERDRTENELLLGLLEKATRKRMKLQEQYEDAFCVEDRIHDYILKKTGAKNIYEI
jgi:hypothetical protein